MAEYSPGTENWNSCQVSSTEQFQEPGILPKRNPSRHSDRYSDLKFLVGLVRLGVRVMVAVKAAFRLYDSE